MLAGSCLQCLRGVAFLEGTYSVLERCLGGACHFGGGACSCFGEVWHCCLEGRGILEEALAVFWRGVAFLLGACSVLEGRGILEGACSVLEGCGILEKPLAGRLQCFGGVWHFGGGACSFGGVWHFGGGACSCFGGVWHSWKALAGV